MNKVKVICKNCEKSDVLAIDDNNQIFWAQVKNIISGRYRLDSQWGWQCICGNNDIVTSQEKREIKNLQAPDPRDIQKVLKNIKVQQAKFVMEKI